MAEALRARIAALTGQGVTGVSTLQGGDLSHVMRVTLADSTVLVAKTGPLVTTEATMLTAIAAAGCAAPQVIAAEADLLLMAHVPQAPADGAGWAALGHGLRALHDTRAEAYGWPCDYAFGAAPILNAPMTDWPTFWAERRLRAFADALPRDIAVRVDTLCQRLPDLLPAHPPAALLHGDLWTGNVIFTTAGGASLIDPACYHGDPEVDHAMLHLFGSPTAPFHDAYGPLPPGWQDRRPIYTLWPALVHLRLFGDSYRGLVTGCLSAAGV